MAAQLLEWGGWALGTWKTFINPAKPLRSNALKAEKAQEAADTRQGPTLEVEEWNAQLQTGSLASDFAANRSPHINSVAVADDARTSLVAGPASSFPVQAFSADPVEAVAQQISRPHVTTAVASAVVKTSPLTRQETSIAGATVRGKTGIAAAKPAGNGQQSAREKRQVQDAMGIAGYSQPLEPHHSLFQRGRLIQKQSQERMSRNQQDARGNIQDIVAGVQPAEDVGQEATLGVKAISSWKDQVAKAEQLAKEINGTTSSAARSNGAKSSCSNKKKKKKGGSAAKAKGSQVTGAASRALHKVDEDCDGGAGDDNDGITLDGASHEGLRDLLTGFGRMHDRALTSTAPASAGKSTCQITSAMWVSQAVAPCPEGRDTLEGAYKWAVRAWEAFLKHDSGGGAKYVNALSSRNRDKHGNYLCFRPRKEEERVRPWEVYKLDLHTPPSMRQADHVMAAKAAVFPAEQYLNIMSDMMGRHLPEAGLTIVTGQGKNTGGKTFLAIGEMLERLKGLAVKDYHAQDGNGAYTVWLNYPCKTFKRQLQR